MTTLVTGAAGFIGYHVANRLLADSGHVVGLDNLNDYYEVSLKEDRLKRLTDHPRFSFEKVDLSDKPKLSELFYRYAPDRVVNLV